MDSIETPLQQKEHRRKNRGLGLVHAVVAQFEQGFDLSIWGPPRGRLIFQSKHANDVRTLPIK
jgi:hypothetical protein